MFACNRFDTAAEMNAVPVVIALLDGTLLKGKLLVPVANSLADTLNGGTSFIEFEPYGGEKRYLAKGQLGAGKPLGVPKVSGLQASAATA